MPRRVRALLRPHLLGPSAAGGRASGELQPPPALPQGNVGTTSPERASTIRSCQLPPSVVRRLGVVAPSSELRCVRDFVAVAPPSCWRPRAPAEAAPRSAPPGAPTAPAPAPPLPAVASGPPRPAEPPERAPMAPAADTCSAGAEGGGGKVTVPAVSGAAGRAPRKRQRAEAHQPRPPDDSDDGLDEPIEKAPHYEKTDRLDSAAGYLYEDVVEDVWDKHEASGLVHYTDAAFWDRMAGGLDERAHDGWDVEEEHSEGGGASAWSSDASGGADASSDTGAADGPGRRGRRVRHRRRGGLAGVRRGAAGRIMRRWGHACGEELSDTLLAVISGRTNGEQLGKGGGTDTATVYPFLVFASACLGGGHRRHG
ncbi:unnamed protein product [Prorocentrum cordatum]|uniref:Uncharacterized protein n=1 Tax=Prorocentrum cordatum TaxID=2364126 RepID=A0ABN9VGU2_9DINO|nr:unnamed protein product [Polarella glacialis]